MITGKQFAGLLLLSTALTVPSAAFAQGTTGQPSTGAEGPPPEEGADENLLEEVTGVDNTEAQDAAEASGDPVGQETGEDFGEQPEISIPGGNEIVVTGRRRIDATRSSSQVISVLSSEQIARTGEGDIAGALGRVTGLSVVGNGFVYVRGLGDRYSLALLNGLPLPSPQPLSRVVPLDIFPTNIVASSLVQKTYSANFPGEFGGGVINLTTQAIPDESFFKVSAGISGDTETTFQNGLSYYGSDYDWFGFDDGRRDAPPALQSFFDSRQSLNTLELADRQEILKQLNQPNQTLLQGIGELPANFSAGFSAGTSFDVFGDGQFGVIATAGLSNKWRNRFARRERIFSTDTVRFTSDDTITDNRILLNGLLGFGLEVGEHKFRLTNLFIRDSLKQAQLGDIEQQNPDDIDILQQDTAWFERQLLDTQFVGELDFGDLTVDTRLGYAQTQREAPYEFGFRYVRTNLPNDPFGDLYSNRLTGGNRGSANVVFSDLTEDLYYGGIDVSYPITNDIRATVGYAYTDTTRDSVRREFDIRGPLPDEVGLFRPDYLLGSAVVDFYGLDLIEFNDFSARFRADLEIHGGYGKLNIEPVLGLSFDLGVRYEDAVQTVTPIAVIEGQTSLLGATALNNDYWLPAATATYEITDDLQVRAHVSRTVARPQFRELIFQSYTDPETDRAFIGNPALVDSELLNAEMRFEYYLGGGNRLSAAGFYKKIDKPIEPYVQFSSNAAELVRFANAPEATLWGGEIEAQYNYDLYDLGGLFETKQAILVANYTYTNSEISVGEGDTITTFSPAGPITENAQNFFVDGRPLVGQSDHLVNLQLGLEDTERLQQLTFLVTYASERVLQRGASGAPDVIEDPGIRLDLVARQGFELAGKEIELKLEARNILGENHEEFQQTADQRYEFFTYDIGQSFSASVSVEF